MMDEVVLTPSASASPSRREVRRQTRRETILDVAAQSFLDNGYAATTMNAIAATLGGSKGTLWNHFPSKDVLFAAVLERKTEAFRAQLDLLLRTDDAPATALPRFCRTFIERIACPDAVALHRLVIGEVQRFPEIGRIFYERAPLMTRHRIAAYLAESMARGELRRVDADLAAHHLTQLCMAGAHQSMLLGLVDRASEAQIRADADNAADVFLRAYGP